MPARETGKTTYNYAVETMERGLKARNAVCHQDFPDIKAVKDHKKALADLQHLLNVELRNDATLNRDDL